MAFITLLFKQDFDDFRDADDAVHDLDGKELLGDRVVVEFQKSDPSSSRYNENYCVQGSASEMQRVNIYISRKNNWPL